MNGHENDSYVPTSSININNESKTKERVQRIAKVFIAVALLGLLTCAGLLILGAYTHKPAFELPRYSSFKSTEAQLLGYFSLWFFLAGCLTLFIASNVSKLTESTNKKRSYILVLIGTSLVFGSFWLFYLCNNLEQQWWGYLFVVTWGISYIFTTLSELLNTEHKILRNFLKNLGFILMFLAVILSVFDSAY